MILALLCVATVAGQATKEFTNTQLGLALTYPDAWKLEVDKRETAVFTIPITRGTAVVDVRPVAFRRDIETWQKVQTDMAESLRREVVRQWQEELLGVPLLLTHTRYLVGGESHESLLGLLYTQSPNKMQFRLIAPSQAYAEVEAAWREALLTLRTTSGALPRPEDPEAPPPSPTTPTAAPPEVKPFVKLPDPDALKPKVKGRTRVDAFAAGRPAVLYLPEGWDVTKGADGSFALTHPKLAGRVVADVAGSLDAPAPDRVLRAAVNAALSEFSEVKLREEPAPRLNRAHATVAWVRRSGRSPNGFLLQWHATVTLGDLYCFVAYRADSPEAYAKDRPLVEQLLSLCAVEAVP